MLYYVYFSGLEDELRKPDVRGADCDQELAPDERAAAGAARAAAA